jgi:hypothetical protein
VVDIFDPDFMTLRTGLISVDEAKRVAGDLLRTALTGWLAELDKWQRGD